MRSLSRVVVGAFGSTALGIVALASLAVAPAGAVTGCTVGVDATAHVSSGTLIVEGCGSRSNILRIESSPGWTGRYDVRDDGIGVVDPGPGCQPAPLSPGNVFCNPVGTTSWPDVMVIGGDSGSAIFADFITIDAYNNHDVQVIGDLSSVSSYSSDKSDLVILNSGRTFNVFTGGGDDQIENHASSSSQPTNTVDTLKGGSGHDSINGSNRRDSITGGTGQDSIYGSGGNDTITSADGGDSDAVHCGSGTDSVGKDSADWINSDCETVF